jgi:RimJ/RimL family protein N-acetyltransferase
MGLQTASPFMPITREQVKQAVQDRVKSSLAMFSICEKSAVTNGWPQSTGPASDYYKDAPPAIGVLRFKSEGFDFKNRGVEFGIMIPDKERRGIGYGTEVLNWAQEYVFLELGMHRLSLWVNANNEAAVRAYRKV